MKALNTQVAGNHYKNMKMQPVELFALTRCTAFQANIWKYITRYRQKNGKEDIKKAIHYAQLALELNCEGKLTGYDKKRVLDFCSINKLPQTIALIMFYAAGDEYAKVINACELLIKREYPDES